MKVISLICVLFCLTTVFGASIDRKNRLREIAKDPAFYRQIKGFERLLKIHDEVISKDDFVGDYSVDCAFCGIVVNELEGFIAENISEQVIEETLQRDICDQLSGALKTDCDDLVAQLPAIIGLMDSRWKVGLVCEKLGYCKMPFHEPKDPQPVPTYVIDLDLPPKQRWAKVCSNEQYQYSAQFLTNVVDNLLYNNGALIKEVGELLNEFYYPAEYAEEIEGCADALGVATGWLALFNLGYEVSDACTSMIAQTEDGKIYHARNLDFWAGMGFTDSLKNMTFIADFQSGGETVFKTTTFAGYVGALSGIRPKGFSVTIDTRFYPQGLGELFYEVVEAIVENNASLVSFLSRDVLQRETNFDAALNNLANDELIADVYYILAGVSDTEGAVISRNRLNATDIWRLDPSAGRWFEVETNYDHWEPPPWFDDRRVPANEGMEKMGRKNLSLQGMFDVLSTKPVLNLQSTYTILSIPADSHYESFTRWCPFPCVE